MAAVPFRVFSQHGSQRSWYFCCTKTFWCVSLRVIAVFADSSVCMQVRQQRATHAGRRFGDW
jgi:hypothetical protein